MIVDLFNEVAKILEEAKLRKTSLKSLIYDSSYREKDKNRLAAVTMETQRHLPILDKLISESGADECKALSECLLRVVTYELLFGKGLGGRDGVQFRRAIRPYQKKLKDSLRKLKEEMGAANGSQLLEKFGLKAKEDPMPRWVRVNLLKVTVEEVEETLIADGFVCILSRKEADDLVRGKDALTIRNLMDEYVSSLQPFQFMADLHLPDVMAFTPGTLLINHNLAADRRIILMDKASCIPARILAPPLNSHVIDSCAAPGNKTNHLSCLMQNTGKVFAFDMDEKRAAVLQTMTAKSGCTNLEVQCADFLNIDSQDPKYSSVTHILVDPSCSGSGIVSRKDHLTGQEVSRTRLKLLRGLQLRIVNHAMTFPSVERVVYSTCSVHREENEDVIWRILQANPEFELEKVLPCWHHRPTKAVSEENQEQWDEDGCYETDVNHNHMREKLEEDIMEKCIRASFEVDKTNGFFVAHFKRWANSKEEEEQTEVAIPSPVSQGRINGTSELYERHDLDGEMESEIASTMTETRKRKVRGSIEEDESMRMSKENCKKKKKEKKKKKKMSTEAVPQEEQTLSKEHHITWNDDALNEIGGEDGRKRRKEKQREVGNPSTVSQGGECNPVKVEVEYEITAANTESRKRRVSGSMEEDEFTGMSEENHKKKKKKKKKKRAAEAAPQQEKTSSEEHGITMSIDEGDGESGRAGEGKKKKKQKVIAIPSPVSQEQGNNSTEVKEGYNVNDEMVFEITESRERRASGSIEEDQSLRNSDEKSKKKKKKKKKTATEAAALQEKTSEEHQISQSMDAGNTEGGREDEGRRKKKKKHKHKDNENNELSDVNLDGHGVGERGKIETQERLRDNNLEQNEEEACERGSVFGSAVSVEKLMKNREMKTLEREDESPVVKKKKKQKRSKEEKENSESQNCRSKFK